MEFILHLHLFLPDSAHFSPVFGSFLMPVCTVCLLCAGPAGSLLREALLPSRCWRSRGRWMQKQAVASQCERGHREHAPGTGRAEQQGPRWGVRRSFSEKVVLAADM